MLAEDQPGEPHVHAVEVTAGAIITFQAVIGTI